DRFDADRQGWTGQVGDQCGQARKILMNGMEARDGAIILDSQVDLPAFCVRQADDSRDQVAILQPVAIALELDRQALAIGDVAGHGTSLFPVAGCRWRTLRPGLAKRSLSKITRQAAIPAGIAHRPPGKPARSAAEGRSAPPRSPHDNPRRAIPAI